MESLGISSLKDRMVRELSGGEKIMVALAAAIAHKPGVIVLDEYDSHLDAARMKRIEELIRRSPASYIIRCTQQMETAARGDYVIFLEEGRVISAVTPGEVFHSLADTPFYPITWRFMS